MHLPYINNKLQYSFQKQVNPYYKYDSLNELERNTIRHYNAFSKGYNKTRGNRG